MSAPVKNRVEASSTNLFNLEEHIPEGERILFDLKDWLFQGMVLQEKLFRDYVKKHDWESYRDKHVAVHCSDPDAIIPMWAFMVVIGELSLYCTNVVLGDLEKLECEIIRRELNRLDLNEYINQKVVIKGCSKEKVPECAYGEITRLLTPIARLISYGEPCSKVPVYKRPKHL
ncbi:MAG: DUF2480 family protein [Bacteroidota bacterium]